MSGDTKYCGERMHSDRFETLDFYLPPKTRIYFLQHKYGVNAEGAVINPEGKIVVGLNNVLQYNV